MHKLKHLPLDQWPAADIEAFVSAFAPGDIFDETAGPGAHLAEGTRRMIRTAYRRWLGFQSSATVSKEIPRWSSTIGSRDS
jgi:hypothetical protein